MHAYHQFISVLVSLSPTHAAVVSGIVAVVSEHDSDSIVVLICISLMVNEVDFVCVYQMSSYKKGFLWSLQDIYLV